ncbi:hypothetical protein QE152_g31347 [Popillia japonica]|uniref:Uncharacterized protein n=1 Tax=Popillia japonica TaxID=7064 RepID=A0AAW1J1S9_POPJA
MALRLEADISNDVECLRVGHLEHWSCQLNIFGASDRPGWTGFLDSLKVTCRLLNSEDNEPEIEELIVSPVQEINEVEILMKEIDQNSATITAQDYIDMDQEFVVKDNAAIDEWLTATIANHQMEIEDEDGNDDDKASGLVTDTEKISCISDAFKKITALEDCAQRIQSIHMSKTLLELRTILENKYPQRK